MRFSLLVLAIWIALPPTLCQALCTGVSDQAVDEPCHSEGGAAPTSEAPTACEQCDESPAFVPARADDAAPQMLLPELHATEAQLPAPTGRLAIGHPRSPPGAINSPFARTNPPLLN